MHARKFLRNSKFVVREAGDFRRSLLRFIYHHNSYLSSMTSNFLDNACAKIQNMVFKTSKMDQIALEY